MKIIKRIAALMLAAALVIPGFSLVVDAAEGRVSFTDPKTKTGETVEVACALRSGAGALDSFDITLKYDPEFLAFENGESGVTKESDGVLKFSGKGDGTSRIGFKMNFQALKTGTTKIEVAESAGYMSNGESVSCTNGNSTIKIAEGKTPTAVPSANASKVTVGDKEYSFVSDFPKSSVPVGFTEATIQYDGGEQKIVQNETKSVKLGYLVDAEGKGDFFLYNADDATFSPYIQVTVSPTTSIILLKAGKGLKVPAGYQEVKLTVNESEFPAWQDKAHEGFYLVYAMDSEGTKGFYQYDTQEESYQRFIAKDTSSADKKSTAKAGKLAVAIEENLSVIAVVAGVGLLILIIIIIVLAIKLRHRNLELDDLYQDDDDDDYDEILRLESEKKNRKNQSKKEPKEELLDADFDFNFDDDDFDSDFDDVGFADDYEDDEYDDDFADDYEDDEYDDDFADDYEDDEYDDDFEEDDDEDDEDFDDDFEVDFIDLD